MAISKKYNNQYDVLVVGAGPTGLMLACELKLMGINVAVIERRPHGTTGESRAPGINARTMEILKMRGLAKKFEKLGQKLQAVLFSGIPMNPKAIDPDWPDALILPQHYTESILAERATEIGVSIHWSTELLHFSQQPDHVDVLVQQEGQISSWRANYVAGCDGGHSIVRKICGAVFNGDDPISHWVVGDVQLANPPSERGTFGRNTRIGTYQVSSIEPGWYRVNLMKVSPPADRSAPVTLEELRQAMLEGIGTDYGLQNARWISRYGDGFRQVKSYRYGRVLLLGDAAHTHSPIGGQGLNLGIQDAVNLGWKLGMVIKGQVPDSLLDSFHDERHPVAAAVLLMSKAQTILIKPGDQMEALRAVIEPMINVPETTLSLSGILSGIGLQYSWGEGLHPLVGRRIPDIHLQLKSGEADLFDLMHDGHALLLNFDRQKIINLPEQYQTRITIVNVESSAGEQSDWELPIVGKVPALANIFVRPDGYVAWVQDTNGDYTGDELSEVLIKWVG